MIVKRQLKMAATPTKEPRKVYHDWHDDGLKILDLLLSKRSEHQAAIAKLYEDCPHAYSIDMTNGQRIPIQAHQVAAWAGKQPGLIGRLKAKNLIPGEAVRT